MKVPCNNCDRIECGAKRYRRQPAFESCAWQLKPQPLKVALIELAIRSNTQGVVDVLNGFGLQVVGSNRKPFFDLVVA